MIPEDNKSLVKDKIKTEHINIMVDLETMGLESTAAIIAIGAVMFDTEITSSFYSVIDLGSCMDSGLTVNSDTIIWWMKQSDDARLALVNPETNLSNALKNFSDWLGIIGKGKNCLLWGNGSDFDNLLLSNAYKAVGKSQPWPYWGNRCYRTIKNMYPEIKMKREGTHHNALDDAKSQAIHLMSILEKIRINRY